MCRCSMLKALCEMIFEFNTLRGEEIFALLRQYIDFWQLTKQNHKLFSKCFDFRIKCVK